MKYIYQFIIILLISFVGEILHHFIPLPIPASIYGLVLMLVLLCTKVIRLEQVEKVSDFLIEIMPLMFIPGGVGLITAWDELRPILLPVAVIIFVTTVLVMVVTGKTTEIVMKRGKKNEQHNE